MASDAPRWPTLGTHEAFSQFYAHYVRACTRATQKRYRAMHWQWGIPAAVYDIMVADAVVDSFMAVRQCWGRPGLDQSRPLALLVTIAQRHLLQQVQHAIHDLRHQDASAVVTGTVTEDVVTRTAIHQVLTHLHPREQQAIHGHYLDDRSVREVAATMNTSVAALKCLLQRGRAEFKTLWLDEREA